MGENPFGADAHGLLLVAYEGADCTRVKIGLTKHMRRRQGPAKKLAPANAPERACAHVYREDEWLQLEIDCMECNGAHDLMNRKCLAGVMNALVATSAPEAIVLRRYTHKRYRGEVVGLLSACAAELASLNRSLSLKTEVSDKRCRTCRASSVSVITSAKRTLLDDPMAYMRDGSAVRKDLREKMVASAGGCVDAPICVDEVLGRTGLCPDGDSRG